MYLSSLLIDVGDNPDRPRPGRWWLRNLYHVHQRLCMAFPSAFQQADDEDFLKPFKPGEFGINQVHVKREKDSGFLFRIDPRPPGRVVILVQSAMEPDWNYAFHNARHLLAGPPQVKSFQPRFTKGQRLRFRLVANPTRKIDTKSGPDGQKRNGIRIPVPSASEIADWRLKNPAKDARIFIDFRLFEWLACRAEEKGFIVEEEPTTIHPGYIYVNKKKKPDDKGQRLRTVRYDGILQVIDPDGLRKTVIQGLGPGKAYGLGLLSLAPAAGRSP
jgi:CRISPR system Cascade subunit CasE